MNMYCLQFSIQKFRKEELIYDNFSLNSESREEMMQINFSTHSVASNLYFFYTNVRENIKICSTSFCSLYRKSFINNGNYPAIKYIGSYNTYLETFYQQPSIP